MRVPYAQRSVFADILRRDTQMTLFSLNSHLKSQLLIFLSDNFKSVRCDQCLPNCYDVTYSTLSYKTDLNLHQYSLSNFYTPELLNNDSFVLRVYLAKQVVPVIRKVTVMSWIGLLSDLGGIFNLCLGLSMISVVEFFYYCTFRLYKNYNHQRILQQKQAWN
ncbi:hypothetical protein ACLKA7_014023 [Drosophila subpalustris]